MISQNVLNISKKGNMKGRVFHLFYPELSTVFFFDDDFTEPIMWGNKNVVMAWVKKLDELLEIKATSKVKIFSYIMSQQGYRRIDTYDGPIDSIGKYIRRY
jgi:hypothetical protein